MLPSALADWPFIFDLEMIMWHKKEREVESRCVRCAGNITEKKWCNWSLTSMTYLILAWACAEGSAMSMVSPLAPPSTLSPSAERPSEEVYRAFRAVSSWTLLRRPSSVDSWCILKQEVTLHKFRCTLECGVYVNTWDQKWVLKRFVSGTSHNMNTTVRPLHRMVLR